MTPQNQNTNYTSDAIENLEFPICVQRRPSMYIGGTSVAGAYHCFYEVLDNSVDEAGAGYCNEIIIQLYETGAISVTDNGRGIPVDVHKGTGKSALELVFCTLHAGGKFNDQAYAGKSGGLNGVGASCVNALSTKFRAIVKRDGQFWGLRCEEGYVKSPVQVVPADKVSFPKQFKSGTQVYFDLNKEIFKTFNRFEMEEVRRRAKQAAFLNAGLKVTLIDIDGRTETYVYPEGIKEYVKELNSKKKVLHDIFSCSEKLDTFEINIAFQYNDSYNEELISFANNIRTPSGGTHVSSFKRVLTKTFNTYAKTNNLLKQKDPELNGDDFREGLTAVVSVKLPDIEFEGQTKGALNNESIKRPLETVFARYLGFFLDANPGYAKIIIEKALQAARAREAARKAREETRKKSAALEGIVVDKLAACTSKNPEECELFIVEGDSAGGSAKQARNQKTQAVLPLRGKVINTYNLPRAKFYKNNEIANLLKALNIDLDESEEENVKRLRYHKVILMSDADPDGQHIECLMLTFFYCHARFLIERGFIYVAEPPLYKVTYKKQEIYMKDDEALNDWKKKNNITSNEEFKLMRFKGLGEMMPKQLEETAIAPESRSLKRISLDDIEQSSHLLEIFLGSDTTQRKEIILSDFEIPEDTDEEPELELELVD